MDPSSLKSTRAGRIVRVQSGKDGYSAFFPNSLPPSPHLQIEDDLLLLTDEATHALGKLDGITLALPDPEFLLYTFLRKEAVLSSQIEGTQSSLSDLLLFEHEGAPGAPVGDVLETFNYLKAMQFGLDSVRTGGLPLSSRLIRELHRLLLEGVRGGEKMPGEFRRSQNWIGGTMPGNAVYVPPPHTEIGALISNLEEFMHSGGADGRPLIKAALVHAQFESIHPFMDGNGRIGRLLVTLMLCSAGVLERPMLYLSLYFMQHRARYYELLQRVRFEGAFEEWLAFFLKGVIETSTSVIETTKRIKRLTDLDRERVRNVGRAAPTALSIFDLASREIAVRAPSAAESLGISEPSVNNAIAKMESLGILREITGKRRNRVYIYESYLSIVDSGLSDAPG